jgi:hypothetical protein
MFIGRILKVILILFLTIAFQQGYSQVRDSLSCYPVQLSSNTNITFGISNKDTVSLGLYNLLGQSIKSFIHDSIMNPGYYSMNFKGDTLADGIYILILRINKTRHLAKKLIKTTNLTGVVKNEPLPQNLNFKPNPTIDLLEIPITGMKHIIVTDQNGKICMTIQTEQENISFEKLQAGVYTVSVFSADNILLVSERIIRSE